jgi:hypothetical protein
MTYREFARAERRKLNKYRRALRLKKAIIAAGEMAFEFVALVFIFATLLALLVVAQ